jgi:hypothetical protein
MGIDPRCFEMLGLRLTRLTYRHCEARSNKAIHPSLRGAQQRSNPPVIARRAATKRSTRHCEARSNEAIHPSLRGAQQRSNPPVIARRAATKQSTTIYNIAG